MSIKREYEIVLQPKPEGGFSVFGPELPSAATQGETIKEAIAAYFEVMHEDGLPNPYRLLQQRRVSASPMERTDKQCAGSRC